MAYTAQVEEYSLPNLEGQRWLVVDDEGLISLANSQTLKKLGATVTRVRTAENGLAALTTKEHAKKFKGVISDYDTNSDITGGDMFEQYCASKHYNPETILIASSGSDQERFKNHNIPNLHHLPKPLDQYALHDIIESALSSN